MFDSFDILCLGECLLARVCLLLQNVRRLKCVF